MAFKREGKSGGVAKPLPGVTFENYIIRAEKFEDAEGTAMEYARAAGKCFMIDNSMHRQQSVWRHYYNKKGMEQRVRDMKYWLGEKGVYAVPAEWPWLFDQSVSEEMFRR